MVDVQITTAAEVERQNLPQTLKAKTAARSRAIGANYERDVGKKLGNYFGISDWKEVCYRTKPHGMAQPTGDLKLINDVGRIWKNAGLGPIECKRRKEWSFSQFFKSPEKSMVYGYFCKSNEDTKSSNSVVIFTKPGTVDLVFYQFEKNKNQMDETVLFVQIKDQTFVVQTLKAFLQQHFPEPQSLL